MLWLPRWVCPPRRRVLLPPLTCLPALHDAMNPAMMNPDMMKAAQDMMSKMSPEDMQKMMKMQQQMCAPPERPRRKKFGTPACHLSLPIVRIACRALAGCKIPR